MQDVISVVKIEMSSEDSSCILDSWVAEDGWINDQLSIMFAPCMAILVRWCSLVMHGLNNYNYNKTEMTLICKMIYEENIIVGIQT